MSLLFALSALVPVLHVAHVTGLRNTLAALITVWAVLLLVRDRRRPPLIIPMLCWLALALTSSLWSPDPESTLKAVLTDIVMPLGIFCAAWQVSLRAQSFLVLSSAIVCGSVILAAFVLLALSAGMTPWHPLEAASGILYYYPGPGVTSTLAVYALPFALLFAGSAGGVSLRCAGYVSLGAILMVGLGTLNRMFWPAFVVTLATYWLWQWPRLSPRHRGWIASVLLAFALAGAGMVAYLGQLRDPADYSNRLRLQAFKEWGALVVAAPPLGHGFGRRILRNVQGEKLSTELTSGDPSWRSHAHNLVLNVVLQVGFVGLIFFCFLLASLLREAYHARDPVRVRYSAALAALLVAMLAKNMTDDFMNNAVIVAFWAYAGMVLGRISEREPHH
jgi:O-antigen ligase